MYITSLQNQTVKSIISLKDKKARAEQSAYLVEGVKMVQEAVNKDMPIKLVIGLSEVVDGIKNYSGEKIYTDQKVLDKISDCEASQGVLAVLEMPKSNFCLPNENCVYLDRVRDPGNLGTIIRTSVACGIKKIYLNDCVDPYSPKVVRSTMSGIYSVELIKVDSEQTQKLANNINFISADMCGENVFNFKPNGNFCLCMGNEANGLSDEVRSLTKNFVSIPMENGVESLNVGVAYGIIVYVLTKA